MIFFWRKIVDESDAFLPEFRQLLLQPSLKELGWIMSSGVRGHDMEETHPPGAMRQWALCHSSGRGQMKSTERRATLGLPYSDNEWSMRGTEGPNYTRDGQLCSASRAVRRL